MDDVHASIRSLLHCHLHVLAIAFSRSLTGCHGEVNYSARLLREALETIGQQSDIPNDKYRIIVVGVSQIEGGTADIDDHVNTPAGCYEVIEGWAHGKPAEVTVARRGKALCRKLIVNRKLVHDPFRRENGSFVADPDTIGRD